MLKSPFKSVIARAATFALVLSLGIAFVSVGLTPGASAQMADDDPCKMTDKTVTCSYDENGTDPVANFSALDPEGEMIVWSLDDLDAADFDITGGVLSFKKSPSFESPTDRPDAEVAGGANNIYEVDVIATEVRASGSLELAQSTTLSVTVNVKNVEEPSTLTLNRLQVRAVGTDAEGQVIVGSAVAATLNDPDGAAGADLPLASTVITPTTLLWYVPKVNRPELENENHWVAGGGVVDVASYTPAAGEANKYLRVVATYTDGAGTDSKKAYARSAYPVGEARATADNNPPEFPNGTPDSFNVREDAPVGTVVGTVRGSDNDSNDILSHELGGANASLFAIDIATGRITVAAKLDFETATRAGGDRTGMEYIVTVTPYDPSGTSPAAQQVFIAVTDVNDAPLTPVEGDNPLREIVENHLPQGDPDAVPDPGPRVLGTYTVSETTDPDAGDGISALTLSTGGPDGSLFSLTDTEDFGGTAGNNTYELGFKESPNYESPADADGNNKYHVTIITADNEGATHELPLVITVLNVDEEGEVTLSTSQPAIGQALTATLTDPDTGVIEVEWQWKRSNLPDMGFLNIGGATSSTYTPVKTVPDNPVTTENEGVDGDEGKYLQVEVMYHDNAKDTRVDDDTTANVNEATAKNTLTMESDNAVREEPEVNQAPVFESGITRMVPEDAGDGGNAGAPVRATDPDEGDALSYTITGGADMGSFEITAANRSSGQITVKKGAKLNFEGSQTTYMVEVTARDPFGLSASTMVTIMVTDVNEAPELTPPGDPCKEVQGTDDAATCDYDENGTDPVVNLSATDPEGEMIVWSLDDLDAADFDITGGVLSFKKSPSFESPSDRADAEVAGGANNIYELDVIATEVRAAGSLELAQSATLSVTVNVKNVEEPSTLTLNRLQVRAVGTDAEGQVIVGSTVAATLNDPDGAAGADLPLASTVITPTTLLWYVPKVSRPELENEDHWIAGGGVVDVASYTPAAGEANKYLRVVATYTDGAGTDSKKAYARSAYPVGEARATADNNPPEFPNGTPNSFNVREDAPVGTVVGTVRGSDNDSNDILSHELGGANASLFAIDIATGRITVAAKLDFETATRAGGDRTGMEYIVTVTPYDPSGTSPAAQQVFIAVTDVNDAPLRPVEASPMHTVDENHVPQGDPDAVPPAPVTVLSTYTVSETTDPDAGDGISALTLSTGGPDGSLFSLTDNADFEGAVLNDNTYELLFKESPNYESPADADGNNKYHVTIITADNEGATNELPLVITVLNVDEEGEVTLSTSQPAIGQALTATLTDPDMKIIEVEWQWSRSNLPDIGFLNIRGATSSTYTPVKTVPDNPVTTENEGVDGDEGKYLRVEVMYHDNAKDTRVDDDTTANVNEATAKNTLTMESDFGVREQPEVNQAPVFESGITRMVPEDAGDGGNAGAPVKATDPDGDALSYTITGGADMGSFEITAANRSSGQMTVKKGTDLDYEGSQTTYMVEVTADDPFGKSASTTVTIIVTDVNEAPELVLIVDDEPVTPPVTMEVTGDDAVDYEENGTDAVATYTSTIATPTWTLLGVDMDDFSISGGELSFSSSPDYEAPTDENNDNVYMVTVVASNGGGEVANLAVTVTVTNDMSDDETTPPDTFDPLSYDGADKGGNENGVIDRPEVIKAIRDYFADMITREQVIAVITAYFN